MRTLIQTMLAGILLAASLQVSANLVIMDSIVAVVDEDVILQSEMQERIDTLKAQITDASQLPPDDVLRQQIVERLIVESLQLQMADRAGVRISDEEINEALQGVAEQNRMSVAQFRAAIEKDGISYASMRRQIEREMMIARVQQGMMRNRIEISEQEIKNFLASELGAVMTADEYRIAHILIPLPEDASATQIAEIQADAEDLLKQLAEGADFSALAVGHSAGQNALSGGDLGWRKIAQLPSMFRCYGRDNGRWRRSWPHSKWQRLPPD